MGGGFIEPREGDTSGRLLNRLVDIRRCEGLGRFLASVRAPAETCSLSPLSRLALSLPPSSSSPATPFSTLCRDHHQAYRASSFDQPHIRVLIPNCIPAVPVISPTRKHTLFFLPFCLCLLLSPKPQAGRGGHAQSPPRMPSALTVLSPSFPMKTRSIIPLHPHPQNRRMLSPLASSIPSLPQSVSGPRSFPP